MFNQFSMKRGAAKKIFLILLLVFGLFSVAAPAFTQAAEPLVQCESENYGAACTFCEVFHLINRVIKLILYGIIPPLAVVAFVYAGILLLFGGAAPKNIETGKKIIQVTVIGILIAYSGWLIVNTILQQLVNPASGLIWWPWNEIPKCAPEGAPVAPPPGPPPPEPPPPGEPPPEEIPLTCAGPEGKSPEILNIISCMQKYNLKLGDITTTDKEHKCDWPNRSVSCHYGGPKLTVNCYGTYKDGVRTGGQGHAVDFGGYDNAPINEATELQRNEHIKNNIKIHEFVQKCGAASAFCESANGRLPCDSPEVNHIHANDSEGTPSKCGCN